MIEFSSNQGFEVFNCLSEKIVYSSSEYYIDHERRDGYYEFRNKNGRRMLVDSLFRTVISDIPYIGLFDNGIAIISSGEQFGCINEEGDIIIPCNYKKVKTSSGLIFVEETKKSWRDQNTVSIFSKRGKIITSKKYSFVDSFHEGLCEAHYYDEHLHENIAFIDKSGVEKFKIQDRRVHRIISPFHNGLARIAYGSHSFGFINKNGEVIADSDEYQFPKNSMLLIQEKEKSFFHNLHIVMKEDQYGFIDNQGRVIVPIQYDDFYVVYSPLSHDNLSSKDNNSIIVAKRKGKYGILNSAGIEIIPCLYDNINCLSENCFSVKKNGKLALFKNNSFLTDFIYDRIGPIINERAFVIQNGYVSIINSDGYLLVPLGVYIEDGINFSNGGWAEIKIVQHFGRQGFLDLKSAHFYKNPFDCSLNYDGDWRGGWLDIFSDGSFLRFVLKKDSNSEIFEACLDKQTGKSLYPNIKYMLDRSLHFELSRNDNGKIHITEY